MGLNRFRLRGADLSDLVLEAQEAPTSDSAAMEEVIRRFEPLAMAEARRLTRCPHEQQDLTNVARLAVMRAVENHDGRDGFAGYVKCYVRGAVLRDHRSWRRLAIGEVAHQGRGVVSRETLSNRVHQQMELQTAAPPIQSSNPWGEGEVAEAMCTLTLDQQHLLTQRFRLDFAVAGIAIEVGTSSSAVSQRLNTALRKVAGGIAA